MVRREKDDNYWVKSAVSVPVHAAKALIVGIQMVLEESQ
jgi:hypothetical protein